MNPIVLFITPLLVSVITQGIKKLPAYDAIVGDAHTAVTRLVCAFVSLVWILLIDWHTGSFDEDALSLAVQTVVLTFITWLSSLGIFHAFQPAGK